MDQILNRQRELTQHPIYQTFNGLESIQHFMRYHVFAVWDFMSLLKSLQRHLTCVTHPWIPSQYPAEMVRLINQIVLGEESDLDQFGNPTSHFDLYLKAMEEIGASTAEIRDFITTLDLSKIPDGARKFVTYNLEVAQYGHVVEVAASFFYGREKLIPEMFEVIVATLKKENIQAPTFLYYLERHIEVDSGEHGPLAMKCLDHLVDGDERLKLMAYASGQKALEMRQQLWDDVLGSANQLALV
ncbi:MAG: DUF3050 domain-containing protein [Bdellovibrionales bacterium]|nr:DUF3050 domain-containing protein [Bdellovibrionales bacterium]